MKDETDIIITQDALYEVLYRTTRCVNNRKLDQKKNDMRFK